tara:strand:- start:22 stop:906 length:885 start_codon:yes stop_codon:yes gene_type:complete
MKFLFHKPLAFLLPVAMFCLQSEDCAGLNKTEASGAEIMKEVDKRHQQFPYIYEEQSLVMLDRNGERDTRKARRYLRMEDNGSVKFLLLFDDPQEIKGVALLAHRHPNGITDKHIYLPAYGQQLLESAGDENGDNFLGTDFSVENLTGEIISDYRYKRGEDKQVDSVKYFVIDVFRQSSSLPNEKILRRHYIQQDNLFITLTHHFDKHGRIARIQSHHDLKVVDQNMLRANMILMENKKDQHLSLIKTSRRIFSHDYVPEEIFTAEWLFKNYPYVEPAEELNLNSTLESKEIPE